MNIVETQQGFEISFPYNEEKVKAVKSITRSYWNGSKKVWVVPIYMEAAVESLKRQFGIMTDPVVQMPEQIGEVPPMPELLTDIPLNRQMYPFQKNGVAAGIINKRFINADQQGLGKTTQAIATLVALNAKCTLIICPSTLKYNWQTELAVVSGKRAMILDDKNKTSWENYFKIGYANCFIVNFQSVKKFFVKHGWDRPKRKTESGLVNKSFKISDIEFKNTIELFDSVIIDESHRLRNADTLQTKFAIGIAKGKRIVQCLTGTPLVNTPGDLAPQIAMTGRLVEIVSHLPMPMRDGKPDDISGYKRYIDRYCGGNGRGATNLRELKYRLFSTGVMFRRLKKDVLKDLPDKTRKIIKCDLTNRDEYLVAKKDFKNYLLKVKGCSTEEVEKKMRGEFLVKIGVLLKICARGKMEAVKDYVDDLLECGEKVVMFCVHHDVINAYKVIYPDALVIHGGIAIADRDIAVRKFQNDPRYNNIILQIDAGGVGLTLTAASNVGFIEHAWTFAANEQAEDRTHRISQKDAVEAAYFQGNKTVDEWKYGIVENKKQIGDTAVGSDFGGTTASITDTDIDQLIKMFDDEDL